MSNYLNNFNNIYANLSQSAYPDAPNKFPIETLNNDQLANINVGKSVSFNYSQTTTHTYGKNGDKTHTTQGGQGLPNNGVVYLQPEEQKRIVA